MAWGAQGGDAQYNGTIRTAGAKGGYTRGWSALTEGTVINIYVGGQGASSNDSALNAVVAGGYNGGGKGYDGDSTANRGAGGGGATDFRIGGTTLNNRVIVAAGGAGGNSYSGYGTKYPGYAGGASGADGYTSTYAASTSFSGKGGTSSGGGAKGYFCGIGGSDGSLGLGGDGETFGYGSGGGGGGYFGGGGGGCGTAAGGGSSYYGSDAKLDLLAGNVNIPDPTEARSYTGRAGNGYARISYSFSLRVSSFTTSQTSPTNISASSTISYSLNLNQVVSDFAAADLAFAGTSTCNTPVISGSGQSYTITVTNCSEGNLILQLISQSITSWGTGPPTSVSAPTIIIDRTAPSISSVSGPANNTFTPTTTVGFSVAFNDTMTITGSPRLVLTVGALTRYATYNSMSDSKTALFNYTVGTSTGEFDTDGIAISSTIDLNGGSISDRALNTLSSLVFSPPNLTSVLAAQAPSAPTITSISVSSGSISIYFTSGLANGSTITNYQYATNGSTFKSVPVSTTTSPLIITTVSTSSATIANGTTYQIKIRALTSWGQGGASNQLSATPVGLSTITISLAGGVLTVSKGQRIGIIATVNTTGKLTILANGSRISGCVAVSVISGGNTCMWKPSVTGAVSLTASFIPATSAFIGSSAKSAVTVGRRSGTRS